MSTPLNKLCELIVDCPHSTAPDEGEGYPLIRAPSIGPGYLDLTDVHRVSKETYDIRNARAVPQPMDIILAREAPAGNVGIVRIIRNLPVDLPSMEEVDVANIAHDVRSVPAKYAMALQNWNEVSDAGEQQ